MTNIFEKLVEFCVEGKHGDPEAHTFNFDK